MNGFEKHAAFYRAYLTEDRSLIPLTVALATIVGLWLLVYLVAVVGPDPEHAAQPAAKAPAVVQTTTR